MGAKAHHHRDDSVWGIRRVFVMIFLIVQCWSVEVAMGQEKNKMILVSPKGDDSFDGTTDKPVATLHRAQQLARIALSDGYQVNVTLREGTYRLSKPLEFNQTDSGTTDSPVVWQAEDGKTVIVSGGSILNARWEPFRDGIFKAQVPTDFSTDQLFINGKLMQMARYPNFDPNQRIMNGFASDCISVQRASRWMNPEGGYIHAMHSHLWGDYHYLITGKNSDGSLRYEGGWQNNRQMGMHNEYRYVENIFEELDAPCEWYHDKKTDTLYVFPPVGIDLKNATIESVHLKQLLEFRGNLASPVSNITIRGIVFTHASRTFMENREPLLRSDWTIFRSGALFFDGASHCRIEKCQITQVGGNAVFFSNFNRGCVLQSCIINDVGANGVAFVGDPNAARSPLFEYNQRQSYESMDKARGPKTNNYPSSCLVNDCLIYRTGRVEKQTAPVQIELASQITIRHCSIYEVPRAGINIGSGCWGGHVIEFCDVFETVLETGDHGSFNSWGRDRFWLPAIKEVDSLVAAHPDLPMLDCIEPITLRNNRWRCDHGWDIDLDDGSSNYRIYNNLCLNGGIKNREGYNRIVENNILVNNTYHPHVWYANSGDVFRRNIISTEYQPVNVEKPWGKEVDSNLLHQAGVVEVSAGTLASLSGRDEKSRMSDALFVDPAKGNYEVAPASPAMRLGFVNFPMDRFGVTTPELQAIARKPQLPKMKVSDGPQLQLTQWIGASIKDVETNGEISATGMSRAQGVLVVQIPPDSKAASLGLQYNDVILSINSQPVSSSDVALVWSDALKNGKVKIMLWRAQKNYELEAQ